MMTTSFDKRIAELDAYLQMLLEKNEYLDKRIELAGGHAERAGLELIKSNLESLLGSIKHAIVLLQIAKVSITSSKTPERPPIKEKATTSKQSIKSNIDVKRIIKTSNNARGEVPESANCSNTSRSTDGRGSNNLNSNNNSTSSNSTTDNNDNITAHEYAREAIQKAGHVDIASDGDEEDLFYDADEGHQQQNKSYTLSNSTSSRTNSFVDHLDQVDTRFHSGQRMFSMSSNSSSSDCYATKKKSLDEGEKISTSVEIYKDNSNDELHTANEEDKSLGCTKTKINGVRKSHTRSRNDLVQSDSVDSNATNTSLDLDTSPISNVDWDALYDEEEDDLGSLEAEGSVIKHLLSQIRIGMDLTKVVLPTFILERRSLLEMYADFFAHPDLFSSIPDQASPELRFVQLVRWYLSAFHAGRKSSVAKKPYNPILGEIFICHWDLEKQAKQVCEPSPGKLSVNGDQDVVEQYSKSLSGNSLFFVSEQVSHHPPVSAFYTENRAKKISCCAQIYTKSKFLGLSIGVHNVGQGVINLLEHNETYTCTFPSAFGRNILGVPWVEIGGPVQIACEQTGYKANVEFLTKPFYGGKKNRVTAELFKPDGSSLMSIDGEWNGFMLSKDGKSGEKKMFIDTTNLTVIAKNVRPIASQEEFESRNVWKEVTRALKKRDVTKATESKSRIEQRQRDLLQDRTERQEKWQCRFFESHADKWTYKNSFSI